MRGHDLCSVHVPTTHQPPSVHSTAKGVNSDGRTSSPTRSTVEQQLFAVSPSTALSYEPQKVAPLLLATPQQLHPPAVARLHHPHNNEQRDCSPPTSYPGSHGPPETISRLNSAISTRWTASRIVLTAQQHPTRRACSPIHANIIEALHLCATDVIELIFHLGCDTGVSGI